MTENALIREAAKASRARELLEDALLQEAFAEIENTYLAAWRAAPARDTEGREGLWFMLRALDGVKGHLKTVLETGRMAEEQLRLLRSQAD
jgi:hypothetical protein